MARFVVLACLVACSGDCQQGTETRRPNAAAAAIATTAASRSTLVVSTRSEVVTVLADVQAGAHTLAPLPPDASITRVTAGQTLTVETVQGVDNGHSLWPGWDQRIGTVHIPTPPTPVSGEAVQWVLLPGGLDRRLGTTRQLPVARGNVDADGALDLFLRVTEDGVPVATGFSTGVRLVPSDADRRRSVGRAAISGWSETPTLVRLEYTNTSDAPETVSLDVDGWRGTGWIGFGSRHTPDSFEVEPRGTTSVVDALAPAFHDGFFARWRRTESGERSGGFAELRVRHAVPAESRTFALSSADVPGLFERVRWDPDGRSLHLDWTNVACRDVEYVLLETVWSLRHSESGRTIEWTVLSPVSDQVQLPKLPADNEVDPALVDPAFAMTISVGALAVEAPYARAAGLDGRMTPADVGEYSCLVGHTTSIR